MNGSIRGKCQNCQHCTATSLMGKKAFICSFRPLKKEVEHFGWCIYFNQRLRPINTYIQSCAICERRANLKGGERENVKKPT